TPGGRPPGTSRAARGRSRQPVASSTAAAVTVSMPSALVRTADMAPARPAAPARAKAPAEPRGRAASAGPAPPGPPAPPARPGQPGRRATVLPGRTPAPALTAART